MNIPFVKASACGNDFLIIEGKDAPADMAGFTRRICNRHEGAGADGVEWLFPAPDADIHARLLNADGSEAEISGNGTRCVAAYLCAQQERKSVVIRTGAGLKSCALTARNNHQFEFEIDMGAPQAAKSFSLRLGPREVTGLPVSMGNPHYVMFVEEFAQDWQGEAAEIGKNPHFPEGTNVELVRVQDKSNIEVRFFERGVGETQSSGTGSSAAAVAAILMRRAASPVRVHAPGGAQTVRWQEHLFLRGPAQIICRGEFFL